MADIADAVADDSASNNATLAPESTEIETKENSEESATPQEQTTKEHKEETAKSWDHTARKVTVYNVNKYIRNKELKKVVDSWLSRLKDSESIKVEKMKKPPTKTWIQVTLEKEEMVEPFLQLINDNVLTNRHGKRLNAARVDVADERKRKVDDTEEANAAAKKLKQQPTHKTPDQVRDAITPLWRETYQEQLSKKQKDMIFKCGLKIVSEIKNKFRTLEKEAKKNKHRKVVPVYKWLGEKPPIHVQDIIKSPQSLEYRNKCEFTFGYRLQDGKDVASVGFMASGWSGGVSRPHFCQNVPPEACALADVFDEFLSTSPIPPYDTKKRCGVWKTVMIRTSTVLRQCMIVVQHAPPTGGVGGANEDYSSHFSTERERLLEMLVDKELVCPKRDYQEEPSPPSKVRVTSVFFQEYDGVSMPGPDHPVQHAYGKLAMEEQLGKCTFQISPGAFFQVNTQCAELLYDVVVQQMKELKSNQEQDVVLFDVCCGTGTIGLTCLKEGVVSRIVGVDISKPAIENAELNAELNGFSSTQARFVASRAEHVMMRELSSTTKEGSTETTFVAVVDPAREGLHSDVVKALRACEFIHRLVYVSCNPTATLVRDAGLLCSPPTKKYSGCPFRPTFAQPVDMFPLTPHCEMVMTFDRLKES